MKLEQHFNVNELFASDKQYHQPSLDEVRHAVNPVNVLLSAKNRGSTAYNNAYERAAIAAYHASRDSHQDWVDHPDSSAKVAANVHRNAAIKQHKAMVLAPNPILKHYHLVNAAHSMASFDYHKNRLKS